MTKQLLAQTINANRSPTEYAEKTYLPEDERLPQSPSLSTTNTSDNRHAGNVSDTATANDLNPISTALSPIYVNNASSTASTPSPIMMANSMILMSAPPHPMSQKLSNSTSDMNNFAAHQAAARKAQMDAAMAGFIAAAKASRAATVAAAAATAARKQPHNIDAVLSAPVSGPTSDYFHPGDKVAAKKKHDAIKKPRSITITTAKSSLDMDSLSDTVPLHRKSEDSKVAETKETNSSTKDHSDRFILGGPLSPPGLNSSSPHVEVDDTTSSKRNSSAKMDMNSETSSLNEFRQSSSDITLLSKAVSRDTVRSPETQSLVFASSHNPVSVLLGDHINFTERDDPSMFKISPETLGKAIVRMVDTPTIQKIVTMTLDRVLPSPHPLNMGSQDLFPEITDSIKTVLSERNEAGLNHFATLQLNERSPRPHVGTSQIYDEQEEPSYDNTPNQWDALQQQECSSLEVRRSIRRLNALKELMDTEETYVRDLNILVTHFFAIIQEADCISVEDRKLLVRNAFDILHFQEQFYEALKEAHGEDGPKRHGIQYRGNLGKIARCFTEWGHKFEVYVDYCIHQDRSVQLYNELLRTNEAFANLIERLHTFYRVSYGFSRLKFDDYIIIPFQRILRYRLILQSIIRATQKDTAEYEELSKAQDIMHAIASRLNNEKSKLEAERKTSLFLSRLDADWSLPKRWYKNLGTCLLIGTLEVRYAQHGMKSKRYGCALFNSYMIIVKAKKHKQYEPRYWFPLRLFNLENMHDHEAVSCGWILRNDNQILEFSSICEQEKRIWMDTLGHAIEQTRKQHNENDSDPVEKLFVSSFDQYTAQVSTPMSASTSYASFQSSVARQDSLQGTPRSSTMPNALTDDALLDSEEKQTKNRSLSAVYDKSADSIPPLTSDPSSSSLRARSSVSDFKDFFSANITEKWSHHKYNQYHARRLSIDIKFEDVCTTPILTARSQARQDYGSSYEQWRRRSQLPKTASMMSFSDVYDFVSPSSSSPSPHHTYYGSTSSSPRYHSFGDSLLNVVRRKSSLPTRINGDYYDYPSHPSHQRSLPMRRLQVPPPSRSTLDGGVSSLSPLHPTDSMIFRLSQRSQDNLQPSRPHPEATLPAVANHATLPRSSSHFFGKMKEKFGHLSTPRGVRRNGLNAPTAVRVPKTNAKSGNMAAPSPSTSDHRLTKKATDKPLMMHDNYSVLELPKYSTEVLNAPVVESDSSMSIPSDTDKSSALSISVDSADLRERRFRGFKSRLKDFASPRLKRKQTP